MKTLNKKLSEKDVLIINEEYFNGRAQNYDVEKVEKVFGAHSQKRMENVIKYLASFNNNYFIDIGCGTGNLLKYGHKYFKIAVGYDISEKMLLVAREKGLNVRKGDINNLNIKDNKVDLVGSSAILHHMLYPEKTLKEMHRIIKPGGFIYMDNEPNLLFQESKIWKLYHNIRRIIEKRKVIKFKVYNKPINPDKINKELLRLGFKTRFYFYWASDNIFKDEKIPIKRKILIFLISLLRMKFGSNYNNPLFSIVARKAFK